MTHEGANLVFTEVFEPPPVLIVCGAGDDARPLVTYASEAGFAVTILDHRQAFLTADRFPQAQRLLCRRPEAGVDDLGVDPRTLVIVMTCVVVVEFTCLGMHKYVTGQNFHPIPPAVLDEFTPHPLLQGIPNPGQFGMKVHTQSNLRRTVNLHKTPGNTTLVATLSATRPRVGWSP